MDKEKRGGLKCFEKNIWTVGLIAYCYYFCKIIPEQQNILYWFYIYIGEANCSFYPDLHAYSFFYDGPIMAIDFGEALKAGKSHWLTDFIR